MPAWNEVAHSLDACSRGALESGIAVLLRTALPIAAALLAGWLLRRHDARSRAGIYTLGISAALILTLCAAAPFNYGHGLVTVSLPTPEPVSPLTARAVPTNPDARFELDLSPDIRRLHVDDASAAADSPVNSATAPMPAPSVQHWSARITTNRIYTVSAAVWAIGAAASLIWLVVCQTRLLALCRRARSLTKSSRVHTELTTLCGRLGIPCPILLVSAEAIGPFVTGIRRPAIVLPTDLIRTLDADLLRAILAHELQHIKSRDVLWTFLSRILCAVVWPQPLLWALARRWRETSEEACDHAALQHGCSPSAYARCLVTMAESFNSHRAQTVVGLGMAGSKSALGHRVERIMNHRLRSASALSPTATLGIIAAFGITLLIATRIVSAQDAAGHSAFRQQELASQSAREADSKASDDQLSQDERDLYLKEIAAAQSALDEAFARQKNRSSDTFTDQLEKEETRAKFAAMRSRADAKKNEELALLAKRAKERSAAEHQAAEREYGRALKLRLGQADKRAAEKALNEARGSQSGAQSDKRAAERELLDRIRKSQDAGQTDKRAAEKELDRARKSAGDAQTETRTTEQELNRKRRSEDEKAAASRDADERNAESQLKRADPDLALAEREAQRAGAQSKGISRKMQTDLEITKSRLAAQQANLTRQLDRERAERNHMTGENRALKAEIESLRRELEALLRQRETTPKTPK